MSREPAQPSSREHPVVAMPVLSWRRDQIRAPVQKLKRREFDAAARSRPRGRSPASRADPDGGPASREHVADANDAAVFTAPHGEPFKREGWAGRNAGGASHADPSAAGTKTLSVTPRWTIYSRLVAFE